MAEEVISLNNSTGNTQRGQLSLAVQKFSAVAFKELVTTVSINKKAGCPLRSSLPLPFVSLLPVGPVADSAGTCKGAITRFSDALRCVPLHRR